MTSSSSFFAAGAGNTREPAKVFEGYRFIPAGGEHSARNAPLSWHKERIRWRGEHFKNPAPIFPSHWFISLARGTQARDNTLSMRSVKFILAGAGNTYQRNSVSYCVVYPRWRGEHLDVSTNR
ncbi:hypothetical protein KCP71_11745 [Salmonella enterica subsp. enterica]|nr:hypothetical protein KCP71_11745 [Salmonella enterica subsp. enterica]